MSHRQTINKLNPLKIQKHKNNKISNHLQAKHTVYRVAKVNHSNNNKIKISNQIKRSNTIKLNRVIK